MIRATILVFLFCLSVKNLIAQEPGSEVTLYFKKKDIPVKAIYEDYKFSNNKIVVRMNDKTKRIHVKKLDSLHTETDTFLVKRINARPYHLKVLTKGAVTLYQFYGKRLFIQKGNQQIYPVPTNKTDKYLHYLTQNQITNEYPKLSTDELVQEIERYNKSPRKDLPVIYDSLRTAAPLFVFRIGAYLPSLGFELGISRRFTFANGLSANLFGPSVRDARTFINFHSFHQLRYFIGYNKRLQKGGSNYKYSGFFAAPTLHYIFDFDREPLKIYSWSVGLQEDLLFNKAASTTYIGLGIDPVSGYVWIVSGISFGLAF